MLVCLRLPGMVVQVVATEGGLASGFAAGRGGLHSALTRRSLRLGGLL